ncbi:MAG: sugar phosphate nucleotidyltransferase [Pseudobdellovibrio sp.]
MNLFFLAAGLGTRFQPLTLKMPKPAIPFLNVPLGYYNFRFLSGLNKKIHSFVINTHYLPKQIENLYSKQKFLDQPPIFSNELDSILGTAGGLKKAQPLFIPNEPIIMMNADEILFTKNEDFLSAALTQHKNNNSLATLVVMKHPEAGKKFGGIWCKDTSVKHIGKLDINPDLVPWHYVGIIILSWNVLNFIEADKEQNIFYDILINHLDKIEIFPIVADWFETGNQIDFLKATETVLQELAQLEVKDEYKNILNFIEQTDPSELIKMNSTLSLISKKHDLSKLDLYGFNVISESATTLTKKPIRNSVLFFDETLISNY